MLKKTLALVVMFSMLSVSLFTASPVVAESPIDLTDDSVGCIAHYAPVCGTDNVTYSNACEANVAGYDVSYGGECKSDTDSENQEEEKKELRGSGMLIEIGSTDLPTTLIVRENKTQVDYTINIDKSTVLGERHDYLTKLSDWIPGDQISIIGLQNSNTGEIDASVAVNRSIKTINKGINGWITNIDKENSQITYQWANVEHTFKYNSDTRIVAGLKNPASVDDLKVNDRIRGRMVSSRSTETPTAKIIVVLRRGEDLFMKIRTFVPKATLVRLDSVVVPTTIQVRIKKTPGLKAGDVNNLIGTEGALVTVNVTENTELVRKYFGRTTLNEFSINDDLHIVGRYNDDGTIDAKVIKNESVHRVSTKGHAGVVTEVDVENSFIYINWTPIEHKPLFRLKKILKEEYSAGTVSAQSLDSTNLVGSSVDSSESSTDSSIIRRYKETIKHKINGKTKKIIRYVKEYGKNINSAIKNKWKSKIKKVKDERVGKHVRKIKHKKVKINRIKHPKVKLKKLITRKPVKRIKVEINENTKIFIGSSIGTIKDIKVGDKIRGRGIKHTTLNLVVADTIVVVSSLPEIDGDLNGSIDDINEIVEVITTEEEEATDIVTTDNTNTEIEIEIDDESGEIVEVEEEIEVIDDTTTNDDSTTTGTVQ